MIHRYYYIRCISRDFLLIDLCLTTALQHGKSIEGKGFHFVFTREGIYRGEETDASAQFANDVF